MNEREKERDYICLHVAIFLNKHPKSCVALLCARVKRQEMPNVNRIVQKEICS